MLSREKRLVKDKDFQHVYQKGRRLYSTDYNVNFIANRMSVTRVGIVVGKKFSKKAVERNRVKRVLREEVRRLYDAINSGYDIVIFVKKADLKNRSGGNELEKMLKEAGVLR